MFHLDILKLVKSSEFRIGDTVSTSEGVAVKRNFDGTVSVLNAAIIGKI